MISMNRDICKVIQQAIGDANRFPFLFVGSGLSRRYMGSPGWVELLERVSQKAFGDEVSFLKYRSRAHVAVENGEADSELPFVATLMENDANDALLDNPEFVKQHRSSLRASSSPLRLLIADIINSYSLHWQEELGLLAKAGRDKVSGIITTNYDEMCEEVFPDFKVFEGQDGLLFAEQGFAKEIYKIHGSVGNPDGMVLSSADYAEFEQKRKYLSAKLLTVFVEYPVVFLGYSIQDHNIRMVLSDIAECLDGENLNRLQKRLIFVQHGTQTEISSHSFSFGSKMVSMTKIVTDDFSSVYEALNGAERLYSTELLRELRGSIYQLADKIDPSSPIVVSGIDNALNSLDEDQRVIIGFAPSSASMGKPITVEDIFRDVVLDNLHYDNKFIVENYLNSYVRQRPNNMPVFKYIRGLGDDVGKYITEYLPSLTSIDSFKTKTIRAKSSSVRCKNAGCLSVMGLVSAHGEERALQLIPYLEEDEIDVDELCYLLRGILERQEKSDFEDGGALRNSHFRKCVRIYDFLRYRDEEAPNLHQ